MAPVFQRQKPMRVSRNNLVLSVLLISLALVGSASANSVKLKYLGGTGSGIGGGAIYPYNFSINDSSKITPLICDSYDKTVTKGETWTANAMPFLQGISTSMFGSSALLDYKAAGLIFKSVLSGTLSATKGQWAIWGLFSTTAQ